MSRTSRAWTFQQAIPEGAAMWLLVATLVLEAWDLWSERAASTVLPISREDCFVFCAWSGAAPKSWGSYTCECHSTTPGAP